MGNNETTEITYEYEYATGTTIRYFAEVQGKDYEINYNNRNITINTEETKLENTSKLPEVTVTSSNNEIVEVQKKEEGTITLTSKDKGGKITITVTCAGKPITCTVTIELFEGIIESETDPTGSLPDSKIEVIEKDISKGIVIETTSDNKKIQWVWVVVPKSIMKDTTTDLAIETALQNYATDYREGNKGQGCNWKDEWYDYCGTTYDGENEYSQVKYITSSDRFNNAKTYYGKIYTDNTGTTEAESYASETTYYAKVTDKINDRSGCGLTYSEYNTNKSKMLQSIKANGGFWIEQFEDGRTRITCSKAQEYASQKSQDATKTSSLMFGIQWDLVCKYLEESYKKWPTPPEGKTNEYYLNEDSSSWGKYSNNSLSDKSEETNRMNIYDFAGNYLERTLEHAEYYSYFPCSYRGGSQYGTGSSAPASYRYGDGTSSSTGAVLSFRSTFY